MISGSDPLLVRASQLINCRMVSRLYASMRISPQALIEKNVIKVNTMSQPAMALPRKTSETKQPEKYGDAKNAADCVAPRKHSGDGLPNEVGNKRYAGEHDSQNDFLDRECLVTGGR